MLTEKQKKDRKNYIGGSDVAIILGLSPWKSAYELYLEKTKVLSGEINSNPAIEWGNRLEPIIRVKFAEENKVSIQAPRGERIFSPKCKFVSYNLKKVIHPEYSFLQGHLDGFIPEQNAVLEIKNILPFHVKQWGEEDTDQIPFHYLVQVAYYVACTNADKAYIAVLKNGFEYKQFLYERDLKLENVIISKCVRFWEELKQGIEPKLSSINDLKLKYPYHKEKKCYLNEEIKKTISKLREINKYQEKLSEREKKYKFKIMEYMQDSEIILDESDQALITWRNSKNGSRRFLIKE